MRQSLIGWIGLWLHTHSLFDSFVWLLTTCNLLDIKVMCQGQIWAISIAFIQTSWEGRQDKLTQFENVRKAASWPCYISRFIFRFCLYSGNACGLMFCGVHTQTSLGRSFESPKTQSNVMAWSDCNLWSTFCSHLAVFMGGWKCF